MKKGQAESLREYRKVMLKRTEVSDEELFELRANFDEDYVVNVITNQRTWIRGPKAGQVENR